MYSIPVRVAGDPLNRPRPSDSRIPAAHGGSSRTTGSVVDTIRSRDGTTIVIAKTGAGPPVVLIEGAFGHRGVGPNESHDVPLQPQKVPSQRTAVLPAPATSRRHRSTPAHRADQRPKTLTALKKTSTTRDHRVP